MIRFNSSGVIGIKEIHGKSNIFRHICQNQGHGGVYKAIKDQWPNK
jgi:hypothetical protein